MKAEHRHQLKTNELAVWISDFPQWVKDNLTMLIIISAAAVLAIAGYVYLRYQKNVVSAQEQLRLTKLVAQLPQRKGYILRSQARGEDFSYILLNLAKDLTKFADSAKDNRLAALALIKSGEARRAGLHYQPKTVDSKSLKTQINQAKQSYRQALERLGAASQTANPKDSIGEVGFRDTAAEPVRTASLIATAQFGLGLCEEELGNFKKAKQLYSQIVANPDFEATTTIVQAKQRLETLANYQQKVVFRTAPKPPTTIPAELRRSSAPVDVNFPETKLPLPERAPASQGPNQGPLDIGSRLPGSQNAVRVPLAEKNAVDTNRPGP